MGVEIQVTTSGLLRTLAHVGARVDAAVLNALDECAALVANDAKAGHPKLGEVSTKGTAYAGVDRAGGRMAVEDAHRVMNPDGSLRWLTRTGVTRNSILPRRARKVAGGFESRVISGQKHSTDLEYGTVGRRAFPYMMPALEKNKTEIRRRLAAGVRRGVEGR